MGKFADQLIESLRQAARHAAGNKVRGLRVSSPGHEGSSNDDEKEKGADRFGEPARPVENRLRQKSIFCSGIKPIYPVQSCLQKYFACRLFERTH